MRLGLGISIPGTSGLVQPAGFSPLDLSPLLWFDASDTSTITESGGAVSQWDDKSGNGNDVTQGTAANQPTTGSRTLNSLNVLDFDTTDYMSNATVTASQPITVFHVAESDADLVAATSYLFDSTNNLDRISNRAHSGSRYRLNAGTDVNVNGRTNSAQLLRIVFNGASTTVHIDGVLVVTGSPGAGGLDGFTLGARFDSIYPWDGSVAEMIFVDGTLTAGEIADTETYLANKWGITL